MSQRGHCADVTLQLFGHEIIAVVCGDVWGVWIGFGIVAAGTLLGELGNYLCVFILLCFVRMEANAYHTVRSSGSAPRAGGNSRKSG